MEEHKPMPIHGLTARPDDRVINLLDAVPRLATLYKGAPKGRNNFV